MTNAELNRLISDRVMLWTLQERDGLLWHGLSPLPDFANSLDACAIAEAEIVRRGLWDDYRREIRNRWFDSYGGNAPALGSLPGSNLHETYCIRLSPRQRCMAMLRACGVEVADA